MFFASSLVEPVNRAGKRRVLRTVYPYNFKGWLVTCQLTVKFTYETNSALTPFTMTVTSPIVYPPPTVPLLPFFIWGSFFLSIALVLVSSSCKKEVHSLRFETPPLSVQKKLSRIFTPHAAPLFPLSSPSWTTDADSCSVLANSLNKFLN
jgi:hypothetical protein